MLMVADPDTIVNLTDHEREATVQSVVKGSKTAFAQIVT